MELTPTAFYLQNIDQQRILVTGNHRARQVKIITSILASNNRPYNLFSKGILTTIAKAPLTIIESAVTSEALGYKHHAILISPGETALDGLAGLLDNTPKSGIVIFPESDASVKALVTKERADVQTLPYKSIPHEVKDGKVVLVSSTNEKFPIQLTSNTDLLLLAAAKELIRKIGISSGQFYRAASTLE